MWTFLEASVAHSGHCFSLELLTLQNHLLTRQWASPQSGQLVSEYLCCPVCGEIKDSELGVPWQLQPGLGIHRYIVGLG